MSVLPFHNFLQTISSLQTLTENSKDLLETPIAILPLTHDKEVLSIYVRKAMAGNSHFNGFSLDENDNDQLDDCLSSLPLEHNSFLGTQTLFDPTNPYSQSVAFRSRPSIDVLAGTQIPNPNLNPVLRPHSDSQLYPRRATAYEATRSYHSGPTAFYNNSTDFDTNGYDQRETSVRYLSIDFRLETVTNKASGPLRYT